MDSRDGLRSSRLTPQGCEEVEHPAHGVEVAGLEGVTDGAGVARQDGLDGTASMRVQIPALVPLLKFRVPQRHSDRCDSDYQQQSQCDEHQGRRVVAYPTASASTGVDLLQL